MNLHHPPSGAARVALVVATGLAAIALVAVVALVFNLGDLRARLLGRAVPAGIDSLAVLPLANLSGDPSQEYFVDGIHDALITRFGQLTGLKRVIATDSALRFKGTKKSMRVIAQELGVAALITGDVLRSGDRVRVTARLVDPKDAAELWSHRWERDIADVLSLENDIVTAIARKIGVALTPQERERLAGARRVRPDTYDTYLKGMSSIRRRTAEGCAKGLEAFRKAADNDPSDPLPPEGIAVALAVICRSVAGASSPKEGFPPARAAALKTIDLNEHSAYAHLALAGIKLAIDFDYPGAEREHRRALELNPSLPAAHADYGWYQLLLGRNAQGLAEMKRAVELDPLAPIYTAYLGFMLLGQDDDQAMAEADKALAMDPDFPWALYVKGCVYGGRKMFAEAIEVDSRLAAVDPRWRFALAEDYALSGRREEALTMAADMEREDYPGFSFRLFTVHTLLGNKEEAFRALLTAYDNRVGDLPWVLQDESFPWKSDPRWQELRRRMNLPPKSGG